jgi:hypothetical protein
MPVGRESQAPACWVPGYRLASAETATLISQMLTAYLWFRQKMLPQFLKCSSLTCGFAYGGLCCPLSIHPSTIPHKPESDIVICYRGQKTHLDHRQLGRKRMGDPVFCKPSRELRAHLETSQQASWLASRSASDCTALSFLCSLTRAWPVE